jgi:hypothetical protein
MTKDDIIRMALEVRDPEKVDPRQCGFWVLTLQELERFSHLVAEHEREECANLCEQWNASHPNALAAAIRARNKS